MITISDYSNRRGALVPLLKPIYSILSQNVGEIENIIFWQQKMRKNLVDISWRFLVAKQEADLVGFFFYRYSGTNIYIEELQLAKAYRNNQQALDGLLKKLEQDHNAKTATFFSNDRMKLEHNKEILASVGFKDTFEDGWENLGGFESAVNAIKVRYSRT